MAGDVAVIVPAAGAGQRLGGRTRKPLVLLQGVPLAIHALRVLQASPAVRWIVVVVRRGDVATFRRLLQRYQITKARPPVVGGASRAVSVARGVAALPVGAKWVAVHDAARPCVSRALIERTVEAGKRFGAVASGLPSTLTVKVVGRSRRVRRTLNRSELWCVQTPQVFRRAWLARAVARAGHGLKRFPDDAAIVEAAGFPVRMVLGDPLNLKVTTRDDLLLARAILRAQPRP